MNKTVAPANRLYGSILIPPDKSIAHRAAMFAAIADHNTQLTNYPTAEDPQSTLRCIQNLGVSVSGDQTNLTIHGAGRDGLQLPAHVLDCGNSGTTMRLLTGMLAGAGIPATLTGDESLSARTMKRIITPLRQMGVSLTAREDTFAPLTITEGKRINPMRYELPVASAQVKSCVLLAGLFGDRPTQVIETIPSRNHTEQMLDLAVTTDGDSRIISASVEDTIPDQSMRIPGDFSAAAFWIVAAVIHPGAEVLLKRVGINKSRTALLQVLSRMGASIEMFDERYEGKEPVADLLVRSSELKATEVDPREIPNAIDELPVLAVAMAQADGTSAIRNAAELRHKETDRIDATTHLLQQAGAEVTEHKDGFTITGNPRCRFESFEVASRHDHRIAMAAAIMALYSKSGGTIRDADAASVSYPGFWDDLEAVTK